MKRAKRTTHITTEKSVAPCVRSLGLCREPGSEDCPAHRVGCYSSAARTRRVMLGNQPVDSALLGSAINAEGLRVNPRLYLNQNRNQVVIGLRIAMTVPAGVVRSRKDTSLDSHASNAVLFSSM